ncbi:MAG: hypothetical protein ACRCY7_03300 [Cetobacterium sp.]|uniref:hypothetical protein n=1 Tax=Cetobacterium sp. TaxID=2071632 RepID=UPI003F419813
MDFKSILNNDLDIFINLNEFGENILIDGKSIKGVISSTVSEENKFKLGNTSFGYGEAIYINQKEVIFKTLEAPYSYKQGDKLELNGCLYEVILVEEDLGMTTLIIGEQGN